MGKVNCSIISFGTVLDNLKNPHFKRFIECGKIYCENPSRKNKRHLEYLSDKQATKISPFPGVILAACVPLFLSIFRCKGNFKGLCCPCFA